MDKRSTITAIFKICNQLSVKNHLLLRWSCIVITLTLQQRILNIPHSSHQGETKVKSILRETVWWAGMPSAVEKLVKIWATVAKSQLNHKSNMSHWKSKKPLGSTCNRFKGIIPNGRTFICTYWLQVKLASNSKIKRDILNSNY